MTKLKFLREFFLCKARVRLTSFTENIKNLVLLEYLVKAVQENPL